MGLGRDPSISEHANLSDSNTVRSVGHQCWFLLLGGQTFDREMAALAVKRERVGSPQIASPCYLDDTVCPCPRSTGRPVRTVAEVK